MIKRRKKNSFGWSKVTGAFFAAGFALMLTACQSVSTIHIGSSEPVSPVDNFTTREVREYANEGESAAVLQEYTTADGICTLKVTNAYFDVTLDEEKATPYEAGRAYGEAICAVFPEYGVMMEPYIFENIRSAFPGIEGDFSPVEARMQTLFTSLASHYQEEIEGLAEGLGIAEHGIVEDGKLSVEEIRLAQMIPDCLRPTACSGLSLWGEMTATGDMLAVRCLEWNLGSDRMMSRVHTVLHVRAYEKSFTSIGFLGLFDVISGVNDDGVFLAMCDAGSDQEYVYEGKTCYSFALRYCLEVFESARESGEYLVAHSGDYTWSHNIMVCDGRESYCAEDAVQQLQESGKGFSVLRDADTPIMRELAWEHPDSLCIVNAFVTEGNHDLSSGVRGNAVRFAKYNEFLKELEVFDTADIKDMMTQEIVETDLYGLARVQNIHRDNLTQMIVIDYHRGSVQAAFTGEEGVVDKPVFYEVESIPVVAARAD